MHPPWLAGWLAIVSVCACRKACDTRVQRCKKKRKWGTKRDRVKQRGAMGYSGDKERWKRGEKRGRENCVPACSVIKRNIDSTPVYRVIHIHGGWRLCLFASVVPSAFGPCRSALSVSVSLLRSSLLSTTLSFCIFICIYVYLTLSRSIYLYLVFASLFSMFQPYDDRTGNIGTSPLGKYISMR